MWHQEFSRVVSFFVEQECATYLKRRPPPERSKYQSAAAPIALHPNGGGAAQGTFIGRLVRALLQLASSRRTAYSEALGAWCDDKGREVVGSRLIHLLHRALGSLGLVRGSP